jgi:cellulose synthase/poly-beta-1,6-N-acetylglucosamine synthase-like glycosyltransferase
MEQKMENKNSKYEPKISIIIPVRNAERTLKTTFEYMDKIDYPREKMELIMADGDSTDSTVEIIKGFQKNNPWVKFVQVKNCKTPGHARNAALKEITGEFVLFTDGDCAPNPDWAYQMVKPFQNKAIGGVGGEVLTLRVQPDNWTESYCEQTFFLSPRGRCKIQESGEMPSITKGYPHEVNGGDSSPFFATANFAVRKEAIVKIGGEFWDEPTGEDVDFSLRIMEAGYKLYFSKEAIVQHMHRVDLKSFKKQYYGYGYGHPLLINKHAKTKGLEIFIQYGNISFMLPFPKKGIIHIGNFHLMRFFLRLTVVSTIASFIFAKVTWLLNLSLISAFLLALFSILYFKPVLKIKPISKFFTFAKIRYASNKAFYQGAKDGQKVFNAICIEPSW